MSVPRIRLPTLRRHCYDLLEGGHGDLGSTLVSRLLGFLVVANLVGVILESVPALAERYAFWFQTLEWLSLTVFTVEYAMRVWVAVEHAPYQSLPPQRARLKYVLSGMGF